MVGRTLSHYEILEKIGEGGMGIVWLAKDIKLGRTVALKVLRSDTPHDRERRKRFAQEARAASALNHPNIITIYEIDAIDGVDFIAMERVQGKPLDELIGRRGLSTGQVLKLSVQVASALDAAHASGIIHRDLKPANIIITDSGVVKVLDFGLAKLTETGASLVNTEIVETDTQSEPGSPLRTAHGVVLGTAAYMSPEQATGKTLDVRSDIFSFGAVLYEMITGQRAFPGDSAVATMSALVSDEPPAIRQTAPGTPHDLERVVSRCLRKDPSRRFQGAADLRVALEELREEYDSGTLQAFAQETPSKRPAFSWMLALLSIGMLAGVGFAWWKLLTPASSAPRELTRLTSDPGLTGFPAISPDGKLLAYASDRATGRDLDLWVQQLPGGEPVRLTQQDVDEYEPAFSPDGSRIAYRSERDGGGVYIMSALGGEPRLLAASGRSPAFSPDGKLLAYAVGAPGVGATFSFSASNLFIIPVTGGPPKRLAEKFAVAHHPAFTPDGKYVVFLGTKDLGPPNYDWWLAPLDGGEPQDTQALAKLRELKFVIGAYPFAIWGDRFIFSSGRGDTVNLWMARFSSSWKLVGTPQQLTSGAVQELEPSISAAGKLVFTNARSNTDVWQLPVQANTGQVAGEPQQLTQNPLEDYYPHVSADGKRVAFVSHRGGSTDDVWLLDTSTMRQTLLLATPAREMSPHIAADGTSIAYGAIQNNKREIHLWREGGLGPEKLCDDCGLLRDVSPSMDKLLLQVGPPQHVEEMDVKTKLMRPLISHPKFPVYGPQGSPDGKWVAFQVVERPTARVLYIAPYSADGPIPMDRWIRVSDGINMDRNQYWSPDGKLMYFLSERDSFRCVWAQKLDMDLKRPMGAPFPVFHAHNAVRNLMNIDGPAQASLSVGGGRLVFAMGEITGNLWTTDLQP
ncbi:MAG TPA: protein kinase [Bryobacteraceae bacterium]|nr:protein kinase [Bryobacteraceae bacterium]